MKVLVFIDHDIICRHFILSGALAELIDCADVRFVFPADDGKRVKLSIDALPLGAPYERLPIDAYRQQTWRWVLFADQLKLRRGRHEAAIRRFRRWALGWKATILLTLAGLPIGSLVFRRIVARRLTRYPAQGLAALLVRERPDVILHPSVLDGVFINDLVVESAPRGIPLVIAMNSWDNPSTKRAVVGWPDWLLVWGEQTREHAIRFIGMPGDKIVAFGAAQFDVFRNAPRVSRAEVCAANGVDSARRLVLFAGSNAQTDEVATLDRLDDAIEAGRIGPVAVIYRPHPWGGGGKGGERLAGRMWRHVVVDHAMRDYLIGLAGGGPSMSLPDYRDTHDLLCAVDAVVSPLSSILLEAALHGKPIVAYAPESEGEMMKMMIPFLHFEEFFALKDVLVARDFDALLAALPVSVSSEGEARGSRLKSAADRFVAPYSRPWRQRIVDLLTEVAQSRRQGTREAAE